MGFKKNSYTSFYTSLIKNFGKIPLDDSNYVPQGCCSVGKYIIVSCYDINHESNSILYIFYNNSVKRVLLDDKMHCGGIAYHQKSDSLFVTGVGRGNKSFINRYCASALLKANDLSTIHVDKISCVDDNNALYSTSAKHSSPSFLTIFNNDLYVGNYVDYSQFNKHKAIIKKYNISNYGDISVYNEVISNPFSNTQGVCVFNYHNKKYFLFSRSFGRKRNSILNICTYTNEFNCINTIVFPSMLEQINSYEDGVIVIFESCAKCYSNTCISNNDGVYYLDFSKLLKINDNKKIFSKGTCLFVNNKNIDIKGNNGQK